MKKILVFALLTLLMLSIISCGQNKTTQNVTETKATETAAPEETKPVVKSTHIDITSTTSDKIKFIGRTYYNSEKSAYCFDYCLSGFELNFKGVGLNAEFVATVNEKQAKDGILYVYVDNSEEPTKQIDLHKEEETFTLVEGLEDGEHTVKVLKRTDISYSSAGLKSIDILGDNAELLPKPADKELKIEFIGDSITSGDGLICEEGEYAYDALHQDATYSYAKLVADYFDADYSVVSRCGMGLIWNKGGLTSKSGAPTLQATYEKVSSPYNESDYDFTTFQPDIIILNIGSVDQVQFDSVAQNVFQFKEEYGDFLKVVRKNNPNAKILCCYGSMSKENIEFDLPLIIEKAKNDGITDVYYMRTPCMTEEEFGYTIGELPSISKQKFVAENYYIPKIKELLNIA